MNLQRDMGLYSLDLIGPVRKEIYMLDRLNHPPLAFGKISVQHQRRERVEPEDIFFEDGLRFQFPDLDYVVGTRFPCLPPICEMYAVSMGTFVLVR